MPSILVELHQDYLAVANEYAAIKASLAECESRLEAALTTFTSKVPPGVSWTTDPNPQPHSTVVDGKIELVTPTFLGDLAPVDATVAPTPA